MDAQCGESEEEEVNERSLSGLFSAPAPLIRLRYMALYKFAFDLICFGKH